LDHLALLEVEVAAFAEALRTADLEAPVQACPGWTVRDVASHVTGIHEWVLLALDDNGPPSYDEAAHPDPVAAYLDASGRMIARLRGMPADAPAWTFDRHDQTAGFWRRRQLHEVSMHRWDVEPFVVDPAVAEDGIDEVLDFFLPRQIAMGRKQLPEGTLRLISLEREWAFGDGRPVVTAHGTASDLLLGLWGRIPQDRQHWGQLTP
jgi:uncharacterized protein (TIGR03083 family)